MSRSTRFALVAVIAFTGLVPLASAGDVKAIVKHGSVVITGSPQPDVISVIGGSPVVIHPGAGTTVNGQAGDVLLPLPPKDVLIDLREGDDDLTTSGSFVRDLRARLGAGADHALIVGSFARDVRIDGGADLDDLDLKLATIQRDLVIEGGPQGCEADLQSSTVNDDVTVRLGTVALTSPTQFFRFLTVGGRLTIAGKSAGTFTLMNSTAHGRTAIDVGGGGAIAATVQFVTILDRLSLALNGIAALTLANSTIDGDATVRAKGPQFVQSQFVVSANGSLTLRSSAPDTTISVTDSSVDSDLRVTLASKVKGYFSWAAGGGVDGDVSIRTGKGDDSVYFFQSTLARNLDIDTGSGEDLCLISGMTVGRTRVRGGSGPLQFQSNLSHYGRFDLGCGGAADVVTSANDKFDGDARFALGGGDNSLTLDTDDCNADLTVRCGDGADTLAFTDLFVGGKKSIKTGGGMDTGP